MYTADAIIKDNRDGNANDIEDLPQCNGQIRLEDGVCGLVISIRITT